MYRVFGAAHTQWWTGYVDDYGVFGSTKEEAEQRGELFEVFMEVIEKPLTDKMLVELVIRPWSATTSGWDNVKSRHA